MVQQSPNQGSAERGRLPLILAVRCVRQERDVRRKVDGMVQGKQKNGANIARQHVGTGVEGFRLTCSKKRSTGMGFNYSLIMHMYGLQAS